MSHLSSHLSSQPSSQPSSQAEVRAIILKRLESLYALALDKGSVSSCVRILDMMARLNGLYDKKKLVPEKITLDDFTEEHLAQLAHEASRLKTFYETKSYSPAQTPTPQQRGVGSDHFPQIKHGFKSNALL